MKFFSKKNKYLLFGFLDENMKEFSFDGYKRTKISFSDFDMSEGDFNSIKLSNNKLITSPWECKVHEKISGALVFGNTSIGGCIFPTCRDIWRTTIMFDVGNLEICFHDKEYLEDFLQIK